MYRLAVLAAVTLSVWTLAAVPGNLWLDGPPLLVTLVAALVCLLPASLTLMLIDRLRKRSPVEKVVAALAAPFIRMILSGGTGAWLYLDWPLIHDHGFAFIAWMVVFYLVTLAVETSLLYIDTTASAEAEPRTENN
jgi:hypothetical protein